MLSAIIVCIYQRESILGCRRHLHLFFPILNIIEHDSWIIFLYHGLIIYLDTSKSKNPFKIEGIYIYFTSVFFKNFFRSSMNVIGTSENKSITIQSLPESGAVPRTVLRNGTYTIASTRRTERMTAPR
jgi:hypothetical protein